MGRKKQVRKSEPPSKRGIAWPRWPDKGTATSAQEKEARQPWTLREYVGKPVWDWLDLLIVPIVLLLITVVFTILQDARQQQIEDDRALQAQRIEDQRAEAERELAEQRAQDEALQAYLNQMSTLILEKDLLQKDLRSAQENLRRAQQYSAVQTLARARTLTVLERLDEARKQRVMRFLYEAGSISGTDPAINLSTADLRGVRLSKALLDRSEDLPEKPAAEAPTVLTWREINLSGAFLFDAELSGTILEQADLSTSWMDNADLSNTDLRAADLSYSYVRSAELQAADLSDTSFIYTTLSGGTDLSGANLSGANLSGANLSRSVLDNAVLDNANLSNANLGGAEGITNAELEQQAASLEGATMPNGQKYEDWLKSKD